MSCSFFHLGNLRGMLFTVVTGCLILMADHSRGQTTLNVTNFGARGDAVQFFANTTSNSFVVMTTTQIPSTAIGDAIEIFGVGAQTYGVNSYGTNAYGNQDLIATIVNVVKGTNIYISLPAQKNLNNAFGTYGFNNSPAFANCISNIPSTDTNTIITIPPGKYLFLPTTNGSAYGYASIWLSRAGITFRGTSPSNTILFSRGAWIIQDPIPNQSAMEWRGFLFEFLLPMTNNYPLVFRDLTLDGGLQVGNNDTGGFNNPIDGGGWDVTSDAIVSWGRGNTASDQVFSNIVFQHWRGEIMKSLDGSTNGHCTIVNCTFDDGNATAINYYPSLDVTNCVFSKLLQVAEYYQAYYSSPSYFQDNLVTNITGNGFAINGGTGTNPPFYLVSNVWYLHNTGNSIETTPGDNVYIMGNDFYYPATNYSTSVALGVAGYQGSFCNSNITVEGNRFINPYLLVSVGSGNSSTSDNRSEDVIISNNFITCNRSVQGLGVNGWGKNVMFSGNDFSGVSGNVTFSSGAHGSSFPLVETNNLYYTQIHNYSGTQYISYAQGSRFKIIFAYVTNTAYALVDTNGSQIPDGAQILIYNDNSSGSNETIYLNSALTRGPVSLPYGQTFVASWTNGAWVTAGGTVNPFAKIQATPPNVSFGTILNGTSTTSSFTVKNTGGGTLSGTASVAAPFSIVSGGNYNLGANQSQTVTAAFHPTTEGNFSQNITLTGGGGATVAVFGSATNAPLPAAIHVMPGTLSFGTLLSGESKTSSFIVQNVGDSTLSGTASIGAPFQVVFGGSYNLSKNQSQTVTVLFNPTSAGNYSQSVILTGGGGATVAVSGIATNAPPPAAIRVSRTSLPFGTILTNTSVTGSFTVKNVGGSTLTGAASVSAPFSIVSGGTYNLSANQNQIVTVSFNPAGAGVYSEFVTLTGGGGMRVGVTGNATNAPSPPAAPTGLRVVSGGP